MRVAYFVVFLLLFLNGGGGAMASSLQHPGYSPAQHSEIQQHRSTTLEQDLTLLKSIYLDTKTEYLVADNIEDEEDTNEVSGKAKLLARVIPTSSYLFTLSRLYTCSKPARPFGSIVSDKYLSHRVLRI